MEHEVKLDRNEMSMTRWMYMVGLHSKKNTELLGLGFEFVNFMIKWGRFKIGSLNMLNRSSLDRLRKLRARAPENLM